MADVAGTWYVVKYMEDLRRREPRNIGVVLRSPEGWDIRFFAEREDGSVDGRTARRMSLKKSVYQAWVDYYRRRLSDGAGAEVILAEQGRRKGNFFVELGGRILDNVDSWSGELNQLYTSLVSDPTLSDAEETFDLKDSIEAIFRGAQIRPKRAVILEAAYRGGGAPSAIRFDYEYVNGSKHLMDAVSLASPSALALAQSFESRAAAVRQAGLASHFVAFVSTAHTNHDIDEVLSPLEAVAEVVNVDDEAAAIDHLRSVVT